MIIAELPFDEELRFLNLASYDLLDTASENDFDDLVELASQICNCPISIITLLDRDRQWFKAKKGLQETGTPRDIAFCSHAILKDDVFLVEDATKDERFADNPLVTGNLNIRFYAGAPIVSPEGYKLGTLCIIDNQPKKLSGEEEKALRLLSNQVSKLLELRKANKLIRQRAEEIVAIKSNTIKALIHEQDSHKKAISVNLHEELAQTLASAILYLKMSSENGLQKETLLKTANDQFNDVLTGMRNLSTSITPNTVTWIPVEELVQEFIEKVAVTFPFSIKFKTIGNRNSSNADTDKALICIRILEQWLKALSGKKDVTQVNINIKAGGEFILQIEDNGPVKDFEAFKATVYDSLVYDRVHSQGGVVDLSVSSAGNNLLQIMLPASVLKVA